MLPAQDQESAAVLQELKAREPIFHRPELGTTRADFERMTADDYWEVGASGRIYKRDFVLDEMAKLYAGPHDEPILEAGDFRCRRLAENVYLLTYNLIQDRRRYSRRATIWERTSQGWKILYHQGTIVEGV
jgi:hypothetical protein